MSVIMLSACADRKDYLTPGVLERLKEKYSSEAINYFYETVFYLEGDQRKSEILHRWENDVSVAVLGNASEKDKVITRKALDLINVESLSVNCSIVSNVEDANVKIFFGKNEYARIPYNKEHGGGFAVITSSNGEIISAEVGIANEEDQVFQNTFASVEAYKFAILLEELTQVLGVTGDSYSYPGSVLYDGNNVIHELSDLDKEVLNLLYDPLIPSNYSRTSFEKDFGDVLNSINNSEPLMQVIDELNLPKESLIWIKDNCFDGDYFTKHHRHTNIYLQGDYAISDSLYLTKVVKSLNGISSNLRLSISPLSSIVANAGIFINYEHNPDDNRVVNIKKKSIVGHAMMFPKKYRSEIEVNCNIGPDSQNARNRAVATELYKVLGPSEVAELEELYYEEQGEIHFNQKYRDVIKLIYDNAFFDGYSKSDFENLIRDRT